MTHFYEKNKIFIFFIFYKLKTQQINSINYKTVKKNKFSFSLLTLNLSLSSNLNKNFFVLFFFKFVLLLLRSLNIKIFIKINASYNKFQNIIPAGNFI